MPGCHRCRCKRMPSQLADIRRNHLMTTWLAPCVMQGAYVVDLKAETQRNHELSEQLAASKVKYKEASSKLKQLQRDHARLLDRKLEGDRRVSTLQQKVQDLKRKCVDSRGGEQSAPQASAARSALPKQQLDKGAASLSGVAEAEKAARLAAEAKVGYAAAFRSCTWLVFKCCPMHNQ